MIIRDYRLHNLPFGARPFHAIVLAGEAAGSEASDRDAERFLRAAEPPAHNRWASTPEVTSQYERGGRKLSMIWKRPSRTQSGTSSEASHAMCPTVRSP
jgi:RNA polymerase primary sigma factor